MRASTRYALAFVAATTLCLFAFPWILRLSAPLASAWADASGALFRAVFGAPAP